MATKQLILVAGLLLIAAGLYIISFAGKPFPGPFGDSNTACTADARICPDGTAVGRVPPDCEFAACPDAQPDGQPAPGTKVTVTARVGQPVVALGETIVVNKVLEDSRCPQDVQCIWAGTVKLDTTIRGGMGDGQLTLELGKTGTSEVNSFALVSVVPAKSSGTQIAEGDYTFTFEVTRRGPGL